MCDLSVWALVSLSRDTMGWSVILAFPNHTYSCLLDDPMLKLHTKYQGYGPSGFRQGDCS